jgi:GNAT superfamily N-acetyltransferase
MSQVNEKTGVDVASKSSEDSRVNVRAAREDEAAMLTEIAVRSKAHWGYDADFMRDALEDLTVSSEYIRANTVYVAEVGKKVAAFYSLKVDGEEIELHNLFAEPQFIGTGLGKLLWHHAAGKARMLGFTRMLIVSEPFAEGFYLAMGAVRIGEFESPIRTGRWLPMLVYALDAAPVENRDNHTDSRR